MCAVCGCSGTCVEGTEHNSVELVLSSFFLKFCFIVCVFETGSDCIFLAGLVFTEIHLPWPP